MTLLYAGLILWAVVHFFKRLAPKARAGLDTAVGAGGAKGIIALLLVGSIVLMVMGYSATDPVALYQPIPGAGYLNNLLMLVAIMLLGAGSSKGKLRSWFRHPMLMGVLVWTCAHLLVNGDVASVVLFGGLAAWALVQMIIINMAVTDWVRPTPGPIKGDIRLLVISLVLYVVIVGIHTSLGYNLFAGT